MALKCKYCFSVSNKQSHLGLLEPCAGSRPRRPVSPAPDGSQAGTAFSAPVSIQEVGMGPPAVLLVRKRRLVLGGPLKSISGLLGSQEHPPQPGPQDILAHLCKTVGQMVPPPEAPPHLCTGVLDRVPVHTWAGCRDLRPQGRRGCWGGGAVTPRDWAGSSPE